MFETSGRYVTDHAQKYLLQMCKHFAHKIDVDLEEASAVMHFSMGKAFAEATDDALLVRFELDSSEHREMAHDVIDRHMERFAFREGFSGMTWV